MSTILITYDLNRPGQSYASLHERIKSLGAWAKPTDSTWLVSAWGQTAESVYNHIRPALDETDRVLVFDVSGRSNTGWLPRRIWEWISQHV
ncbi:hypothetical protein [Leifsonia sp. NPDC077715]|uniref:hypothetical protein n=1 Tax=Leifsonia sp. NPDC077715 TaxID=3155539 RepID=UPI00344A0BEB